MNQTLFFDNGVYVASAYSVVGEKEGDGPLGKHFDTVISDEKWGEQTFEAAERKMLRTSLSRAWEQAVSDGLVFGGASEADIVIGGDLLNQIISASFASRDLALPFLGVYGACSTVCEAMLVGSALIDGGFKNNILCGACSHFSTAERQYRLPLEYGSQPVPSSQWTVTGAGAITLTKQPSDVRISAATIGKVIDLGIKDAANMGAAMAPAACDTLTSFFHDTKTSPADYDLILTGDLGKLGKELLIELIKDNGYDLSVGYNDCGCMIFTEGSPSPMGGSGAGCSASVLASVVLPELISGKLHNVVLAATGALLSPTSTLQGETIPGISYAVSFGRQK